MLLNDSFSGGRMRPCPSLTHTTVESHYLLANLPVDWSRLVGPLHLQKFCQEELSKVCNGRSRKVIDLEVPKALFFTLVIAAVSLAQRQVFVSLQVVLPFISLL